MMDDLFSAAWTSTRNVVSVPVNNKSGGESRYAAF